VSLDSKPNEDVVVFDDCATVALFVIDPDDVRETILGTRLLVAPVPSPTFLLVVMFISRPVWRNEH